MKVKKVLPPTYLFVSILLMALLHYLFSGAKVIPFPWRLFGAIPLALGITVNLVADKAFKKANTTVKPFEESTALITGGVFRISRNPMYLGFVLILVGIAVLIGSLSPFFVVLAFAVLMDVLFIRAEERMLHETFGQAWVEYKKKVRRWI